MCLCHTKVEFQSTRPARGATPSRSLPPAPVGVSIHAPRAGRDPACGARSAPRQCFNPRAPRGARRPIRKLLREQVKLLHFRAYWITMSSKRLESLHFVSGLVSIQSVVADAEQPEFLCLLKVRARVPSGHFVTPPRDLPDRRLVSPRHAPLGRAICPLESRTVSYQTPS